MDANKLRDSIAARGKTLRAFEAAFGSSKTALYRKMKGKSACTREEIQKPSFWVGLSDEEAMSIFLAMKCLKRYF